MRFRVLSLLEENSGNFISGEVISQQLGVSRAAIWKHIKKLRQEGYQIESVPHRGYCLADSGEKMLSTAKIKENLSSSWAELLDYRVKVEGSTNTIAKQLAAQGAPEGTIVLAEGQAGGRGRLGRRFICPFAKGLWFSLILRPKIGFTDVLQVVIIIAVAVLDAIEEVAGIRADIKWPNDLLYQGKKITGILLEANGEMEQLNYLIAGIGINVNLDLADFPAELQTKATSLFLINGQKIVREKLFCAVVEKIESYYRQSLSGGFASLWQRWKQASCILGREISVRTAADKLEGEVVDFTPDGGLVLKLKNGELTTILSGEATLQNT